MASNAAPSGGGVHGLATGASDTGSTELAGPLSSEGSRRARGHGKHERPRSREASSRGRVGVRDGPSGTPRVAGR
eukprot:687324-Alexandrium_andersonii.AAC.1